MLRVNGKLGEYLDVNIGVHEFLFIMTMEALSQKSNSGLCWDLLYADDLVMVVEEFRR